MMDWNKVYEKALEERKKAVSEASFMLGGGQLSAHTMGSFAFMYPDEVKNFFRTHRIVSYIEKRMKRNLQ